MTLQCAACPAHSFTRATDRLDVTSLSNDTRIKCEPCPVGSSLRCNGSEPGAAFDFWAPVAPTVPVYARCPPNVCCQNAIGCEHSNNCTASRTGPLCGQCADGLVPVFGGDHGCAPLSVCSTWRIALGYAIFTVGAFAFVFYVVVMRKNAISDGAFAIFVSYVNAASIVLYEAETLHQAAAADVFDATSASVRAHTPLGCFCRRHSHYHDSRRQTCFRACCSQFSRS